MVNPFDVTIAKQKKAYKATAFLYRRWSRLMYRQKIIKNNNKKQSNGLDKIKINIALINENYNAPAKDLIHNIEAEQQHQM